ncbi:MAG: methyl-accepting chemotaxis protein [Pirellula sp.]|jgi:methyl-accepting chemotaxis protein|nr:methyl-accepting chemotaxis protein [Pirellula sp.]
MLSFIRASVGLRIGLGFGVTTVLMICCAASGLFGVAQLGSTVRYLSGAGPGWTTADSTMETSIHLNGQALATRRFLAGDDREAQLVVIREKSDSIRECLAAIGSAGITPEATVLEFLRMFDEYETILNDILTVNQHRVRSLEQLRENAALAEKSKAALFKSFSSGSFASNADYESFSELRDLIDQWESILTVYQLDNHSSALVKYDEVSGKAMMLINARSAGNDDLKYVPNAFAVWQASGRQFLELSKAEEGKLQAFSSVTTSLIEFVDKMEETGDAIVDGATATVDAMDRQAKFLIVGFAFASTLISIIAALICSRSITRPISDLLIATEKFGNGKLNTRLDDSSDDELGQIAKAFNSASGKICAMFRKLLEANMSLNASATQVIGSANQLANSVHKTTRESTKVNGIADTLSATMNTASEVSSEVVGMVDTTLNSLQEMSHAISNVSEITNNYAAEFTATRELVDTTNANIESLLQATNSIDSVAHLINDLAEQTNLLALNATIEAARAGETGRGFAVVASEVKNLASQTTKATEDIRESLGSVQLATREAVKSIKQIHSKISELSSTTELIAGAILQQSTTTQRMSSDMIASASSVSQFSSSITKSSESSTVIKSSLSVVEREAQESSRNAEQFKTTGEGLLVLTRQIDELVRSFET